jgi:hypothetical protein
MNDDFIILFFGRKWKVEGIGQELLLLFFFFLRKMDPPVEMYTFLSIIKINL